MHQTPLGASPRVRGTYFQCQRNRKHNEVMQHNVNATDFLSCMKDGFLLRCFFW
jgi:hypothetical protein